MSSSGSPKEGEAATGAAAAPTTMTMRSPPPSDQPTDRSSPSPSADPSFTSTSTRTFTSANLSNSPPSTSFQDQDQATSHRSPWNTLPRPNPKHHHLTQLNQSSQPFTPSSPVSSPSASSANTTDILASAFLGGHSRLSSASAVHATDLEKDRALHNNYRVVRRNNTYSSAATTSRFDRGGGRAFLQEHFHPSHEAGGHNSLSAITGGREFDEDEWEKMIGSHALHDDGLELMSQGGAHQISSSPSSSSGSHFVGSSTLPSHRRAPSHPTSAQHVDGLPDASSSHDSSLHHQRSDSDIRHMTAFSSTAPGSRSPARQANSSSAGSGSLLRRHQSLNQHSGQSYARQLATRSSDLHNDVPQPPRPIRSQSGSNSTHASPLTPSSYSTAPWNAPLHEEEDVGSAPMRHSAALLRQATTSPSRFASTFSSPPNKSPSAGPVGSGSVRFEDGPGDLDSPPPAFSSRAVAQHGRNLSDAPNSLMDIHRSLAEMDIGTQPSVPASTDEAAGQTNSQDFSAKPRKLPSLITNRDVLARSAALNSTSGPAPLAGPVSASPYVPPIGHAHNRRSSIEGPSAAFARRNVAAQGWPQGVADGVSSRAHLAALSGPFSAAPAPGWGVGPLADLKGSLDSPGQSQLTPTQWGLALSPSAPPGSAYNIDPEALAMGYAQLMQQQQDLHAQQQRNAEMQAQLSRSLAMLGAQGQGNGGQIPLHLQQMQSLGAPFGSSALSMDFANGQPLGGTATPSYGMPTSPFIPSGSLGGSAMPTPNRFTFPQNAIVVPSLASGQGQHAFGAPAQQAINRSRTPLQEGPPDRDSSANAAALAVDVERLVALKGYNPPPGTFHPAPEGARYFVIKSFTEDDVHKSIKHEIWASTRRGNERLDRAFRENASSGPTYLFFSVNASGHFCGVAEMLTPVDYNTNSNVWAQDGKWMGTFRVRWIFIKDVPNAQLRHIRLTNTPEVKPITQSRDTQELPIAAGQEALRIFVECVSKTSLLQDFAFYEMQSKANAAAAAEGSGVDSTADSAASHSLAASAGSGASGMGFANGSAENGRTVSNSTPPAKGADISRRPNVPTDQQFPAAPPPRRAGAEMRQYTPSPRLKNSLASASVAS